MSQVIKAVSEVDRLQAIADRLAAENPDRMPFTIEHRPGVSEGSPGAFWAEPEEARYFYDRGECLGVGFEVAARVLASLY